MGAGKKRLGLTPMVPQMASQAPVAILDIGPPPTPHTPAVWVPDNFSSFKIFSSSISTSFFIIHFLSPVPFFLQFESAVERAPSKPFPIFFFSTFFFSSIICYRNFMHIQKIYSSSLSTFQFHVFSKYTPPKQYIVHIPILCLRNLINICRTYHKSLGAELFLMTCLFALKILKSS